MKGGEGPFPSKDNKEPFLLPEQKKQDVILAQPDPDEPSPEEVKNMANEEKKTQAGGKRIKRSKRRKQKSKKKKLYL